MHRSARRWWASWVAVAAWAVGGPLAAQAPVDEQSVLLLSLLPPDARAEAAILVPTENGWQVRRDGRNQFVCRGDVPGDRRFSVMCYHKSLEPFLSHQRELSAEGLRGPAFQERLCADVRAGTVFVPSNGAYIADASGTLEPGKNLPDSLTVYHLFQLPYATEESVGLTDEELVKGQPWLHHAGTCDAHIMWSEVRAVRPSNGGR